MTQRHDPSDENAARETIDFAALLVPPVWSECPKCSTSTSAPAGEPCFDCRAIAAEKRDARDRVEAAKRTIPARYEWASLGSAELIARVTSSESTGALAARIIGAHRALLCGGAGAGKTSLAVACLRHRLEGAMFVSALRLSTARREHALGDGDALLVDRAIGARLLLLDDVGQTKPTATCAVKDVVFARHERERPTWVTTGAGRAQLVEMYGDGFVRRLVDNAVVIRLGATESRT